QVLGASHPLTAQTLGNLGATYQAMRRSDEALPLLRRVVAIYETTVPESLNAAIGHDLLGIILTELRSFDQAERAYQRASAIFEKVLGADNPQLAITLSNLGAMRAGQGRRAEAVKLLQRADRILEAAYGPNHLDVAECLTHLSEAQRLLGHYNDALALSERSLGIVAKALGPDHPGVVPPLM